eukprot:m.185784 g.185784  ORF g.185784 m.185784 type:complete len:131 (-) comp25570_c0_seq1:240-632(-)
MPIDLYANMDPTLQPRFYFKTCIFKGEKNLHVYMHFFLSCLFKGVEEADVVVCLACAHPAKFSATISKALSISESEANVLLAEQYPSHECVQHAISLIGQEPQSRVLRKDENWEHELRIHIEKINAKQQL